MHVRRPRLHGRPPTASRRLGLGLVPEGRQIFPTLTVEENLVASAAARFGAPSWTLRARLRILSAPDGAARHWAISFPAASSRCSRSAAR